MRKRETVSFSVQVAISVLIFSLSLMSGSGLAEGTPPVDKHPATILWFTIILVTTFLAFCMICVVWGLRGTTWTLADALSEEADPQPPVPPNATPPAKPVMVASSSRLIALLGLFVILSLFIGVGYYMLWCLFTNGPLEPLKDVTSYFYAGIVLFAPYIVNKFSDAFSIFKSK